MGRLAADLAETFKEGQEQGKQGRPVPSRGTFCLLVTLPPLLSQLEMNAFVEMLNFVSKGVDISMLSNLEKLPLLVNCKS